MGYIFINLQTFIFKHFLMLIGQVTGMIVALRMVIVFFLGNNLIYWSCRKQPTDSYICKCFVKHLQLQQLKLSGLNQWLLNLDCNLPNHPFFGVATLGPLICLLILFIMLGQNMLKLISILFVTWYATKRLTFSLFQVKIKLQIYSPNLSHLHGLPFYVTSSPSIIYH
jgi:hypothetical protein